MTKEEMANYLRHTDLPTLVVEGKSDMSFLRPLENAIKGIDILIANGKQQALYIADHIGEFGGRVAVLVDSDFWSIDGPPSEYEINPRVIITTGYSIENDLLENARVVELLVGEELYVFETYKTLLSRWFASCVEHGRASGYPIWKYKLSSIVDHNSGFYASDAINFLSMFAADPALEGRIHANFVRLFRGKTLEKLFYHFLTANGRIPAIDVKSVMASSWIIDGPVINRIKHQISHCLGP